MKGKQIPGSYLSSVSNSACKAKTSFTSDTWKNQWRLQSAAEAVTPQQVSRGYRTVRSGHQDNHPPCPRRSRKNLRRAGTQAHFFPEASRKRCRLGAAVQRKAPPTYGQNDLHSPNHRDRPGTNVHHCFLARRETNSSREEAEIRVGSASVSCLTLFPSEFCSGRDSALVGIPRRETRCSSPKRS